MIIDGSVISPGSLNHDVVIVGGGPAGITLGRKLAAQGLDIGVFEAGNLSVDIDRSNYRGDTQLISATGELLRQDPTYLEASRLQALGGTSNHWSNWCRPMDSIDFMPRPWVPESGWPIGLKDIMPYYSEACTICGVPPFTETSMTGSYDFGKGSGFITRPYHINPSPTRFAKKFENDLTHMTGLTIYLNSALLDLRTNKSKTSIEHALIAPGTQPTIKVSGNAFVLACGGIENARLMLNCTSDFPSGIGNHHDLVGRYFCEDFHLVLGQVILNDFTKAQVENYNAAVGKPEVLVLHLSESAQREFKTLNLQIDLDPLAARNVTASGQALSSLHSLPPHSTSPANAASLRFILPQAPNRESRLVLTSHRDNRGLRRAQLRPKFTELEAHSLRAALELMSGDLGVSLRGRLRRLFKPAEFLAPASFESSFRYYGYHHNGTTRMGVSESDGVTDLHSRVFDLDNLYIAGSSLFSVSGHAPPTLTIVALALRLADRLKSVLSAPGEKQ